MGDAAAADAAAPLLISVGDAARLAGIGRSSFYSLLSAGRIGPTPIRLGKRVLINRDELARWVAAGCPPRVRWIATGRVGP